jgi:predicted nucleic acid-binding protein
VSFLVDTNVLSELARPKPDAAVLAWIRQNEPNLYVSTITIGELRKGIESLPAGARKTNLRKWLTGLCDRMEGRLLSFNLSTAHLWGQLVARWAKSGQIVPALDSQLAATAHRHGLTMVTRNVADFQNAGVKLLNPFNHG